MCGADLRLLTLGMALWYQKMHENTIDRSLNFGFRRATRGCRKGKTGHVERGVSAERCAEAGCIEGSFVLPEKSYFFPLKMAKIRLDRENDLFQTHLQQERMIRLAKRKRLARELPQILDKMEGKTACGRGFFL